MVNDKLPAPDAPKGLSVKETLKEGMSGYFKAAKESLIFANKVNRLVRIGMGLSYLPKPDYLVDLTQNFDKTLVRKFPKIKQSPQ